MKADDAASASEPYRQQLADDLIERLEAAEQPTVGVAVMAADTLAGRRRLRSHAVVAGARGSEPSPHCCVIWKAVASYRRKSTTLAAAQLYFRVQASAALVTAQMPARALAKNPANWDERFLPGAVASAGRVSITEEDLTDD